MQVLDTSRIDKILSNEQVTDVLLSELFRTSSMKILSQAARTGHPSLHDPRTCFHMFFNEAVSGFLLASMNLHLVKARRRPCSHDELCMWFAVTILRLINNRTAEWVYRTFAPHLDPFPLERYHAIRKALRLLPPGHITSDAVRLLCYNACDRPQ